MRKLITRPAKWLFRRMGYDIVEGGRDLVPKDGFPPDFEKTEIEDYLSVAAHTLTGPVRIISLIRSVRYLVQNHIAGDIVECGVWKGGSMMAVAKTLLRLNERERCLWLYDTYAGMSQPSAMDISVCNFPAQKDFDADYLRVGLDDVRKAVLSVGYNEGKEIQGFLQALLEEEVTTFLGRRKSERRVAVDAHPGYRPRGVPVPPPLPTAAWINRSTNPRRRVGLLPVPALEDFRAAAF